MKLLGLAFFTIVALAVVTFINGFTLSVLWAWVIAETFKVQSITIVQGMGLSIFLEYIKRGLRKNDEKFTTELLVLSVISSILYSGFTLFICWLITLLY